MIGEKTVRGTDEQKDLMCTTDTFCIIMVPVSRSIHCNTSVVHSVSCSNTECPTDGRIDASADSFYLRQNYYYQSYNNYH